MKNKIPLLEQFQNLINKNTTVGTVPKSNKQKYHTVGTVSKSNKQKYHTVGTVPKSNKQKYHCWNSSKI
jgi:hypothetical protein